MNALVMEEVLDGLGDPHVLVQVLTADVGGGDDTVPRQLPHVELMDGQDSLHLEYTKRQHHKVTGHGRQLQIQSGFKGYDGRTPFAVRNIDLLAKNSHLSSV